MRILLIKPKHIGDSLILTPTITAIKQAHPNAEIWVVIRRGCEGILAGCPEIARILLVAPVDKHERRASDLGLDLSTIWQISTTRFDFIFELGDGNRGRRLARFASIRNGPCHSVKPLDDQMELRMQKAGWKVSRFDWQARHRVEKDFYTVSQFLPLPKPIPPLRFAKSLTRPWEAGRELTDFCVVQVGTRQGFTRWHREGWRDISRALLDRFAHVVVTCGPAADEREIAGWVQQELGPRVISTDGTTTWAQLAWLIGRARLYVGPSTAAMHLAAASGCPVVALFGPTIEDHWHPWQVPYRIVCDRAYVRADDPVERYSRTASRHMSAIEVADAVAACDELLAESA